MLTELFDLLLMEAVGVVPLEQLPMNLIQMAPKLLFLHSAAHLKFESGLGVESRRSESE